MKKVISVRASATGRVKRRAHKRVIDLQPGKVDRKGAGNEYKKNKSYQFSNPEHAFIKQVIYRPEEKILAMTLGNRVYLYHGVPEKHFNGLRDTRNKGSYFHEYIKDKYKFSRG